MASIFCPACGDEIDLDVAFGKPERDVGIMSSYIDEVAWPNDDKCERCKFIFSDDLKDELQEAKAEEWIEEFEDQGR